MVHRVLIILLLAAAPVAAGQRSSKVDRRLQDALATTASSHGVIISGDEACLGGVTAGLRTHGDAVTDLKSANAVVGVIHRQDVLAVAELPCVTSVSSNAQVNASGQLDVNTSTATASVLRSTLGLEAVAATGAHIGVAIIDSGIAPLTDFGTRIRAFYDFTTGATLSTLPNDPYGHGTHVAGLIAGSGASGSEYRGVAPAANLIGLKVLDRTGRGRTSDVIRAIDFAIAHKASLGIDVINLSLGHPIYEAAATDPMVQAVERAVRAGIVVVASAGNWGLNPETDEVGYAGVDFTGQCAVGVDGRRVHDVRYRDPEGRPRR